VHGQLRDLHRLHGLREMVPRRLRRDSHASLRGRDGEAGGLRDGHLHRGAAPQEVVGPQAFFFSGMGSTSAFSDLAAGATFSSTGRPSPFRSRLSISARTSGLSFRNCRAFSRPWPMRSPSIAYQAPDFSTTLWSTPRSMRSPSLLIPSP